MFYLLYPHLVFMNGECLWKCSVLELPRSWSARSRTAQPREFHAPLSPDPNGWKYAEATTTSNRGLAHLQQLRSMGDVDKSTRRWAILDYPFVSCHPRCLFRMVVLRLRTILWGVSDPEVNRGEILIAVLETGGPSTRGCRACPLGVEFQGRNGLGLGKQLLLLRPVDNRLSRYPCWHR